MPKQLRLFAAPQPLVERLGPDFFRSAPTHPGIYRMFDAAGKLIYVGKARDLRARLASYRRIDGQPRKTTRLIHTARRIEWQVCENETAACLLENQLIRTLRPRFNRAGTWPHSARYLRLSELAHGIGVEMLPDAEGDSYGAFRGGATLALGAMARLLWYASHGSSNFMTLPRRFLVPDGLRSFVVEHPALAGWLPAVRAFLAGESDQLLAHFAGAIPKPEALFDRAFLAMQLEILKDFYRRGPSRNRRWIQRFFGGGRRLIAPEELDDLRVRAIEDRKCGLTQA
jgi:excinuclease ABC subunit C